MEHDDLPVHLIRRRDVAAWLAGSVNQRITFHNTTPAAADVIRRQGVRIEASRSGAFGQGFHTSTVPDPFYGPIEIAVAVHLLTPLVGHLDDVADYVDELVERLNPANPRITPTVARRIRHHLRADG